VELVLLVEESAELGELATFTHDGIDRPSLIIFCDFWLVDQLS
jgi:hypothetical protein